MLACALLLAAACAPAAPPVPEFSEARAWSHLTQQVAFGPRYPGARGHAWQLSWLVDELRFRADTVVVDSFMAPGQGGRPVKLANVLARFRPGVGERVLLVAHRDTRRRSENSTDPGDRRRATPGANVNASGVAVLLEVAQLLHDQPAAVGVDILLVDGEEAHPAVGPAGTRRFLAGMPGYRPRLALVLRGVGDIDAEFPRDAGSARAATDAVWDAARALGYDSVFTAGTAPALDGSGLALADAGIAAVVVADREYGPDNARWHSVDDQPQWLSRETLGLVGRVVAHVVYRATPPGREGHLAWR